MFIVVGVTGGIAAYKSVQLVRVLVKAGHDVHVIPTENALRFVGLPTWEAISRNPVTTSVYADVATVRHVSLGQSADLVIVAPATANSLAKMASGLADDLLGTTLLATTAPVVVAPAMHTEMWAHPATVHNVAVLRARGVHIVGPEAGELTGGDSGPGRMSEPDAIAEAALALMAGVSAADPASHDHDHAPDPDRDLAGLRVVVTAGGTREPLDPVRFLGNRSSGRQGVALAEAAAARGADVCLITAHVEASVLSAVVGTPSITVQAVGTAAELAAATEAAALAADVIVMAAAVADYRPAEVSERKISKESSPDGRRTLELVQTEDIVAGLVSARRPGQTIVGFAAETVTDAAELYERGVRKRARKGVDLLAVNQVGWNLGFETSDNEVLIVGDDGQAVGAVSGTKREVADALWSAIVHTRSA